MTRMSVAELTLKKQIDRVKHDMDTCLTERKAFDMQYDILFHQLTALETEYSRLADARRKASAQRKGPTP